MRRADIISWATGQWILGWTPVERTDTIVYNWADYPLEAIPDPRYTIGATPIDYQVWYDRAPTVNGVTLVSEREYAQMERDWNLDPNEIYYTYSNTDDGITTTWIEKHPKRETIAYFIS